MARSKFYYHIKRMKLKEKYVLEKKEIKDIFYEHKGRYGYRRITAEMRNRNYVINHKTVQHLMGEMGLKCKIRKVRYRSYRGEIGKVAPNVIDRNFVATSPNRKWATDVTQINIGSSKLYLSPILDMYNGEIISYNSSDFIMPKKFSIIALSRQFPFLDILCMMCRSFNLLRYPKC